MRDEKNKLKLIIILILYFASFLSLLNLVFAQDSKAKTHKRLGAIQEEQTDNVDDRYSKQIINQTLLRVESFHLINPNWSLQANRARIINKNIIVPKLSKRKEVYIFYLDQARFFPCHFESPEQAKQASIYFSAHSIRLIDDQVFFLQPSLHISKYQVTIPNLSIKTQKLKLGYFDMAWQRDSPWLEAGISMYPGSASFTPTLIKGRNHIGLGSHFEHLDQYLRSQVLYNYDSKKIRSWYFQGIGGNQVYALKGYWAKQFIRTNGTSLDHFLPILNTHYWQKPPSYLDGKLVMYQDQHWLSYIKYFQHHHRFRDLDPFEANPFVQISNSRLAPLPSSNQLPLSLSHQDPVSSAIEHQRLSINHHYRRNILPVKLKSLILEIQGRQELSLSHILSSTQYSGDTHSISTDGIAQNYGLIFRPSLFSSLGQSSLFTSFSYRHDQNHFDGQSITESNFTGRLGIEHELRLQSNTVKQAKHQIRFIPRWTLDSAIKRTELMNTQSKPSHYGVLIKQTFSHPRYHISLDHWLSQKAGFINNQGLLSTQLKLSFNTFQFDYTSEPNLYQRAWFSFINTPKLSNGHQFSSYINFIHYRYDTDFSRNRSIEAFRNFVPLTERLIIFNQQSILNFTHMNSRVYNKHTSQINLGFSLFPISLNMNLLLANSDFINQSLSELKVLASQNVVTWSSPCRCWHVKLTGVYRPLYPVITNYEQSSEWSLAISIGLGEANANIGFTYPFGLESKYR